jgi:hypothetical protein
MNVRSAPEIEGYPTSALDKFSKRPVLLAELAAQILNRFEDWYLREPIESVDNAFEARVEGQEPGGIDSLLVGRGSHTA